MKDRSLYFASAITVLGGMFAAVADARAETCTLKLKRLEPLSRTRVVVPAASDYIYRSTSAQHFYMQVGPQRTSTSTSTGNFSEVVKKEPAKYNAKHPFRGVAKLGSGQYGFVLDEAPADSDSATPKSDAESPQPASSSQPARGYSRLHFDLNHNGDLTDDKVIEGQTLGRSYSSSYSRYEFPRVDLTIDADGAKVDYAFFFSVYSRLSGESKYASASLNAAAYREGEITLDGKQRRLVLLDFNSNGRFDDAFEVREDVRSSSGYVYATYGDKLVVDPEPSVRGYRSPYDVTTSDDQHYVSQLVNVAGRFYDLEISPAGEKLTLTPSEVPLGQVTNPNEGFRAVVYGENGFVKISGGKSRPVSLPEGDWKLFSYTLDRTGYQQQADQPEEKKERTQGERSVLQMLADALVGGAVSGTSPPMAPRYTMVSARGTTEYQAVKVRAGQTAAIPFGPPYKPVVKLAYPVRGGNAAQLELSIVGSGGEVCTEMRINGSRPDNPQFTITAPDGEEVASGKFEYG